MRKEDLLCRLRRLWTMRRMDSLEGLGLSLLLQKVSMIPASNKITNFGGWMPLKSIL